jgi:hypothetical protein
MTPELVSLMVLLAEKTPEAKDVKAGWLAFGIFLLLGAAVVFLCFNMVKQLRKAQAAKDAGVYGDPPVDQATGDTEDAEDSEHRT